MIRTNYMPVITEVIKSLEFYLTQDLDDQKCRYDCGNALFYAYRQISDPPERDLADTLLNYSGDLESQWVLEKNHPMFDQDREDFKNSLQSIIAFLKEIEPY